VTEGFLLVDKPAGSTSHDVIDELRRIFTMRRIGHAGTLDPMATGLLVVGLGRATRLLRFVQELPKEYVAEVRFGAATDTGDAEGAVVAEAAVDFDSAALQDALSGFIGEIAQRPPAVSAIKRGGERLHRLARRGVTVEVEPRPVVVHEIELLEVSLPSATLRVRCGKGTYVRVLADDIARSVGSRGYLTSLRRTAAGSLSVSEASTLGGIRDAADPSALVLAPLEGLRDLPVVAVPAAQRHRARHGGAIEGVASPAPLAVALDGEELIGVYRASDDLLVPEVIVT
jgi:tRNA pseudouridine55 synthase